MKKHTYILTSNVFLELPRKCKAHIVYVEYVHVNLKKEAGSIYIFDLRVGAFFMSLCVL